VDQTSRPRRSPTQLSSPVLYRIVALCRKRRAARQIAKALWRAVSTIALWLRRLGL